MPGQSRNQEQWSQEMISGNKDEDFKTLTAKTISKIFYTVNSIMLPIQLKSIHLEEK